VALVITRTSLSHSSLPRLIVVSLHKAGTHLALRLIEELGYERRYFEGEMRSLAYTATPTTFLSRFAPRAAYFLHECKVDQLSRDLLLHWREHDDPKFIFQYRDPRAQLLSQVNYLRERHVRKTFSDVPYHLVFSDVLRAQETERDALGIALHCMGDYLESTFLQSVWMLHHPQVLSLGYERLVGERGGGTAAAQTREVQRVLDHLGLQGDAEAIAARLYDPSQPTFHRGVASAFQDVYTAEQLSFFEARYGHLLDIYGYSRLASHRSGAASTAYGQVAREASGCATLA